MKIAGLFVVCLVILLGLQTVFGQRTPSIRDIQERDFENRRAALEDLSSMKPERKVEKTKKLTAEEIEKFKAATSPNKEDLAKYKDFLRQSKTGIFRLLPNFDCELKNVIRVSGSCANFVPGAWAYSVRLEEYSSDDFYDISFNNNFLNGGGFLTQGILVSLGDVPLESISLAGEGIKYLANFNPEETRLAVRGQFEQIARGVKTDGYNYSKIVKAEENITYAARIIAYRYEDKKVARFNSDKMKAQDLKFLMLDGDKRTDIILAFRIVRKDPDGGITILWKELRRQKAPKMVFQKDEELKDFKSSN